MQGIGTSEARELLRSEGAEAHALLARAHALRLETRGTEVQLCAIINAKSGRCSEDCAFCPQSRRSQAPFETYPLLPVDDLVAAARRAKAHRVNRFSLVTSGTAIRTQEDLEVLAEATRQMADTVGVAPCASLGLIGADAMQRLRDAGLTRYHCNLETARSHFKTICSSHAWEDTVRTLALAKAQGMSLCSGGIFGMGESQEQQVEFLEQIRDLDVDSVPVNFLNRVPGIPLADAPALTPLACLKLLAIARLMMPDKEIRVCGGRQENLRDLQSWLLVAGADALTTGNYLTTLGRCEADDLRMIEDAGLEIAP